MRIYFAGQAVPDFIPCTVTAEKGYGKKEIAAKAGLHPFAAGKYMEQTRYFKSEELRAVLEESADLEERVKTGRLTDTLAVELFLVKYSS